MSGVKLLKGLGLCLAASVLAGACATSRIASGPGEAKEQFAPSTPIGVSAAGNYLAAEHAGFARDAAGAEKYFSRAVQADPGNAAILERAFLLSIAHGDIGRASDLARQLGSVSGKSRMAQLILSLDNLKARRFAEAGEEIDAASNRDFTDVVWVAVRAWTYAGSGDTAKALAILTSEETRKNLGAFALYHEALILDYAGRLQEAERAYASSVVASQAQSVRLVEAYGRFLSRLNRTPDAAKLFAAYAAKAPGNPIIAGLLAEAEKGHAETERMIATPAQGAAEGLYGIAVVLSGDRSPELPLVYVQLALYLNPQLDIAHALRGELLEVQEDWEGAAKSFGAIPRSSPLSSFATVAVARDLAQLKRYKEATKLLRADLRRQPADADALIALGDLYRAQEKWTEAADSYAKALEVASDDKRWSVLYARGVSLERAGNWPRAEQLLKEALALRPNQPQILNYLGYSWIDRGENLKEALALITKAVAAKPDDGYIVDSLGWAYYRLGDYKNATKYLEQAVELKPNDPTINDHLGDAYWQVGRRREAQFQWNHALTFEPEPEDAVKIAKKLESGPDMPMLAVTPDSRS